MRTYAITVAFCPAVQLARTILEYRKYKSIECTYHIVVLGYYPINCEKNNRDIKLICDAFENITLLDPGKNLGSAQSQWWALQKIGASNGDFWINVDPDSCCKQFGWDNSMGTIMGGDSNCIVISCRAPLIEKLMKKRNQQFVLKEIYGDKRYGILEQPTPFNLSMWRYSFFKELGGIPQGGEMWGEVEGHVHYQASLRGKYQAYLMNFMEEETGKLMQDKQLLEFKDLNMRTAGPNQFIGIYEEYLKYKYPELLTTNTFIPDNTEFQ